MSRPTDWSPLARSSDPTPGDSAEAAALARRYQNTADEIDRQAKALGRLSDSASEAWDSEASKTFAKHAGDLSANIAKAHGRYAAAAGALAWWSEPNPAYGYRSPMEHAQVKADAALAAAVQAQADQRANSPQPPPKPAPGQTDPDPQAVAAHKQRESAYSDAEAGLRQAKKDAQAAEDEYVASAKNAASQIDAVSHHDALHDSFWDGVSGWIHDHAKMISKALKIVGWVVTALAVAALVASLFIPGFQVFGVILLSELLEGLATGGVAFMLLGHSLLAANGDGSWLDVALDVLAIGGYFGGRALTRGIVDAAEGAVGPAADAAASRAAQQFLEDHASSIARWSGVSRLPVIRTLLGASRRLAAIDAGAATAADDARQAIVNLRSMSTLFGRLESGGPEAADALAKLQQLDEAFPGLPGLESALTGATGTALRNAALKYSLLGVDLGNHDIEETTDWKKLLEPYVTYPILPLPWKSLAPAGGDE
jgi:hypothetical protein